MKNYNLPGTRYNRLFTTILKTDVEVGLTFSTIALQSVRNESKRERNRKNARIAHDSVLRHVQQLSLSGEDMAEIYSKLAQLKGALLELGESF